MLIGKWFQNKTYKTLSFERDYTSYFPVAITKLTGNTEEIVEIEKRQEILVGILRDIASSHPEVRDLIMQRLSTLAKEGEVITVVHNVQ